MKSIYLTESDIDNYPLFVKDYSIESEIREYNDKELLKIFYEENENKIKTLENIEQAKKEFASMPELLIFKAYITDYTKILGILLDKGYKMNLQYYLTHEKTTYQEIIFILKKIGEILEKLKILKEKEHILKDFYIGDMHERNILIDKDTKRIQFIDLDSCKIGNNHSSYAKYLSFLERNKTIITPLKEKYPWDIYHLANNTNTDLYCYIVMILKYLFSIDITNQNMNIKNFQIQLNILKKQGLPEPLYQAFLSIYKPYNTINPYSYLEDIPTSFEKNLKPML